MLNTKELTTDLEIGKKIYHVLYSYLTNQKGKGASMSKNQFRELNDNEDHMLLKLGGIKNLIGDRGHIPAAIEWEHLTVSYENLPGEFTVCLIRLWVTEYQVNFIWRGVSRRAKDDKLNKTRGEAFAFKRAILYSYPVEV